ncbi:MAG: 4-amino-4-deoxy-L-arabinose transferase-like glycosyltransferase, partial [Myxococcota bacterium]
GRVGPPLTEAEARREPKARGRKPAQKSSSSHARLPVLLRLFQLTRVRPAASQGGRNVSVSRTFPTVWLANCGGWPRSLQALIRSSVRNQRLAPAHLRSDPWHMHDPPSAPADRRIALVAGAVAVCFLTVSIGAGSHFDSDDALYAQMAREMVQSGDFVDNRWSGVVLFEKPPLYLWSLAASGATLGWSEASLRIPGTLFAVLAIVSLFFLATGFGANRRQAVTAAGLLAGSTLFVLLARRLMTDMPLVACALAAAACLAHGRTLGFGAFCGLAVLAKGPAAVPLLGGLVIAALWMKRLTFVELARAIGLGLFVAAPWHILVTLRHGREFWDSYLGHHVAERATQSVVPGLSLGQMGGVLLSERLLFLGGVIGLGVAAFRRFGSALERFALVWLVVALVPPLISTTRLPHYLLPVVPAFALFAVAAVPSRFWTARLAPLVAGCAVVASFVIDPAALAYWLDPDFGREHKRFGALVAEHASADDQVAAFNTTTAALTFYANRPVLMVGSDTRFNEVQQAVLMVRRSGLHRPVTGPGFPAAQGKRFVLTRLVDVPRLAARLRHSSEGSPLFIVAADRLALLNDAGVGEPLE